MDDAVLTLRNDSLWLSDKSLSWLGYDRPSPTAVRDHCRDRDAMQRSHLWGVRRDNGNAERIVVEGILDRASDTITWSIVGPRGLAIPGPSDTTFESVMQYIEATWIPVRLIPQVRVLFGAGGQIVGVESDEEIIDRCEFSMRFGRVHITGFSNRTPPDQRNAV